MLWSRKCLVYLHWISQWVFSNYDNALVGNYRCAVRSQQHFARKTLVNRHVATWLLLSQARYDWISLHNHAAEILWNCILGANECNKGITKEIINESENISGPWMRFNRHESNHISVDQGEQSGSPFIRRSIGAIIHLSKGTSFARSKGRWHNDSGHTWNFRCGLM